MTTRLFDALRANALFAGVVVAVLTPLVPSVSAETVSAGRLDAKAPVERELLAGEVHVYEVAVAPDRVVIGTVDQRGVDLVVRVVDPSGRTVATVDSPNGTNGPEPWMIEPSPPGTWRIEVAALATGGTGRYQARISEEITAGEHAERVARLRYRSPRMLRLWKALRADRSAIDRFSEEMAGHAPIVEPIEGDARGDRLVTFVFRAGPDTHYVGLMGGPIGPEYEHAMLRFEGTDLWYLSLQAPKDLRITYRIRAGDPPNAGATAQQMMAAAIPGGPDPWNPSRFETQSVIELPGAPAQPWIERRAGVPDGRVVDATLKSAILGEDRKLAVYLPAGFDSVRERYPYVVVFDGEIYGMTPGSSIPTPVILDNLIAAGEVPPMLAVLVANQGTRVRDLLMSSPFCEFLSKELVPWLRAEHGASDAASDAILAGSSAGGLTAAYCAFRHPDVFGNVLSQSGAFHFTPGSLESAVRYSLEPGAFIRDVMNAPPKPVRFWMEVGLFEGGGWLTGADMRAQNLHLRDVLALKGNEVHYHEFAGGHDYICWRGSLADGLIELMGNRGAE